MSQKDYLSLGHSIVSLQVYTDLCSKLPRNNYLQYSRQKLHEAKTVAISLCQLSNNSRNRPEELLWVAVPGLQVVHNFVEEVPVEIQTNESTLTQFSILTGLAECTEIQGPDKVREVRYQLRNDTKCKYY